MYRRPAIFSRFEALVAAESTRHGGVSPAPWASLNLGKNTDDDPANYTGQAEEVPPTTTTSTPTQPTAPPADVDRTTAQRNPLVRTGADVLVLALVGAALLAGGFLLLGARRRRNTGEA